MVDKEPRPAPIPWRSAGGTNGANVIRINRERLQRLATILRVGRGMEAEGERDQRNAPVPESMAPLAVATWNVHSCVGGDARFSPDRTAAVIRALEVDAIGLQEIGWHHRGEPELDQFAHLARETGMTVYAAPTKHNDRAHYGNALLTRLPVRSFRSIDLSLRRREPRGGLEAVVDAAGRPVRLIVAHLGLDPWERAQQIEIVAAIVDEQPSLPTVFMGDLNEWLSSSPRLDRLAQIFDDWVAPRSFNARLPTLRLDRVYVRGGLALPGAAVVRTALTRHASDHLPVRVLLGVP
jgi:endonuclease/exonuclease/phosphatase family metal-dependent hydrolase